MYLDAARITRAARTANCRVFIIRLAIGEEVRALLIRASELHCTSAVSYIASRLIMSGVRADVYDDVHFRQFRKGFQFGFQYLKIMLQQFT